MASFTIRVEEDGGERRWARAQVDARCTLGELEEWLERVFELAPAAWSFTRAGRTLGEDASFTGPGDEGLRPGEDVEVGALAWRTGVRWVQRSSATPLCRRELSVEAVHESAGDGLRELERGAQGRSAEPDAERLAARVVQAAGQWERELDEGRTPAPETLRARAALALEALRWVGRDDERQIALEELADGDALAWLLDLPSGLSEVGDHERALELCEALVHLRGEAETRGERMFLLARAGRAAEARLESEAWLAREPDDPWAWIYSSDMLAQLGDGRPAAEGLERAAALGEGDTFLQIAVAERRLMLARDGGDTRRAAELEETLEDLQIALEDEEAGLDEVADGPAIGRNDPCPCGSGMKAKRCCGAGAGRGDAARVLELLEELAREADQPKVARALRAALPRFAGEALEGCSLGEALPLLPRDDLPEALVHWAVLDCDLGDGTRVVERVLERRRRAGARERELLERLAAGVPTVWRAQSLPDGDVRLADQLDAAADPVLLRGADGLPDGALVCARLLELDGEPVLGPGTLVLVGREAEDWLATVRARLSELRAAEPDLEWRDFLRRHAHELYRPLACAT
jgi:tetratricopeptide (TPR) repeat protein